MNDLTTFFTKIAFSILTILIITSCGGGDDKGVPPTDKKPDPITPTDPIIPPLVGTVISGVVMIGPVINADVTVSEITLDKSNSPIKLTPVLLDTTSQQTNDKGEYALSIKPLADNTPILVCATGGTYTEPASAALLTTVEKTFLSQAQLCPTDLLCEEEKLCAVAIVKRDEKLTVNLTYFSHLAYGLAESRLIKGATLLDVTRNNSNGTTSLVLGGISIANRFVSDWLQLTTTNNSVNKGVISVTPQDITLTPTTNSTATLTNEIKYGLANAAISDLVEWIRLTSSTTQKVPAFDKVSTVALAQQVFKDIIDGDMDGKQNATSLFLSDTAIIGHMLRYHFAFKLFVVASNRRINQTGLNNSDIDSFVKALNKNGVLFPSTPQVIIVNDKPVLSHVYPNNNDIINGDVSIKIDATDINDISSIAMTIDTVPPGGNPLLPTDVLAANPEKPEWFITTVSEVTPSTPGIVDGIYDIKFVATNTKGVSTTRLMPNIRISNKDIHLHIVNPPIVSNTVGPKNPVNSLASFTAIVNDVFFMENSSNSSVKFSIISTDPQSALAPITVPLKITPFNEISPISRRYFASDLSNANPVIVPDGKYKLVVDATSGKNITPLLLASENVEFEYDTQTPSALFTTLDFAVFSDVTGLATVNLNVTDPLKNGYSSGIKTTFLSHDALAGGEIPVTVTNNQSVFNFTEQGWHNLTLNAVDFAGNNAKTKSLNVGFDSKPPSVMIPATVIGNEWWNSVDIVTNVNDNETGIKEIVVGFDHADPNTLQNAAIGSTVDLKDDPKPPQLFTFRKYTETINANTIKKLGLSEKVYSFMARALDYAGQMTHDILPRIGFDVTAPTITFLSENVTNTIYPAVGVKKTNPFVDVASLVANITINGTKTSATINWGINAEVVETGYEPKSLNGDLSKTATASGIRTIFVASNQISPISDPLKMITSSVLPAIIISSLPQYAVSSKASINVKWDAIATCPLPTQGNTMSVNSATTLCEELDAAQNPVPDPANQGQFLPVNKVIYQWTKNGAPPSYPIAADFSNRVALDLPASFASKKTQISIIATDKSLPSGNTVTKFSCLNFRIKNTTPDSILLPVRTSSVIATDAGAIEPTPPTNTQDPNKLSCVEPIAKSLVPILNTANAILGTNKATCTLQGATSTQANLTITTALSMSQNFAIEVEVETPQDPFLVPAVCP